VTFDDLNLNKALRTALDDLEFIYPTPIQKEAFPVIMSGRDVVGIAQTGTGKTFSYLLPILKQHKYSEKRAPSVLIIVPTRELVVQLVQEIEKLTKYMTVRFAGVYGGTNINTQKKIVYAGLDILVATPGRLLDLTLTGLLRLKSIKKLVIDEVDEMLNLGFRPQLFSVLELVNSKRQNLMFSATMTKEVDDLIDDFFNYPHKIEIVPQGTPLKQIIQRAYDVPNFYTKVNMLEYLLKNETDFTKVLVFIESKKLADKVFEKLSPIFPDQMGVMHSNKSQNYRMRTIENFENGKHRVIVATSILARGLDITDITHVINFDIPNEPEDYIHRIGRTGRKDKDGTAISFFNQAEKEFQEEIEAFMNIKISMVKMPEEVEISKIFAENEKPSIANKSHVKNKLVMNSQGAFHEKKEKNKKVNRGGSWRRKVKKHKNPIKRSSKK